MSVKNIIYETLEKDSKAYIPVNHNPSSASFKHSYGTVVGKDLLSLYYKWTGVPASDPPNKGALLTFKLGDGVHEVIGKILNKAGIKHMSEVAGKFQHPLLERPISYRVDGLIENRGDLEVLEIKSSTEEAMFEWKNISIEKLGPKEEHLLQVICYLNLVPGVKRARLLYMARDTGNMLEYVIESDGDSKGYTANDTPILELNFAGIVARWAELERLLKAKVEPLPEFKVWLNESGQIYDRQIKGVKYKSDWQAKYSPYKTKIYLDPKNFETATYNAEFKRKGLI